LLIVRNLGKPVVCDWDILADSCEDSFFAMVASAELDSEHPIGKAIVQHALDMECDLTHPTEFEGMYVFTFYYCSVVLQLAFCSEGKGIKCVVNGTTILIGTRRLMNENGIKLDENVTSTLATFQERGCT
jgi:Cu+-exporting ATPase